MNPALALRHVTVRFGQRTVLDNVNLSVQPREVVAILGASGSGKTTLLRIIAGILSPQSGRVFLGGQDATAWPRRDLGYVFQDYALWPHLNVRQHLELVGGQQPDALLARVGLLAFAQSRLGPSSFRAVSGNGWP